jgi:hypothetical protein
MNGKDPSWQINDGRDGFAELQRVTVVARLERGERTDGVEWGLVIFETIKPGFATARAALH